MRKCFFCTHKIEPSYKDPVQLEKFLTVRKKIVSREESNLCARHQRTLAKEVKHARFLALLPYVSYQRS
ncbi:MAG TPA: 30S ribosomal protein S18 [Patescibacteria group bacterium]|nr:30S ribosomal protein S18 [Patescibacteria group bacterium]